MALLGGVQEVAARLGVSRQRVGELKARTDFPEPIVVLAGGPVWDLEAIDRWVASGARRGPGRPSSDEWVVGGRFAIEQPPLGSGGFADVFRAVDRRNGEIVAVKVLKNVTAIDSEEVRRFRRELRIMEEQLDHPHVARLIAHGDFSESAEIWCAMPLAVGSLQDEISRMADDLPAVTDLARQLCAGVAHIHGRQILHRDLKPANILKSVDGLWQVSDFGLARENERQSQALTTTLAQGMGTYIYASPEQWQAPRRADRRDDIYSIGKILQHAITGQVPFMTADQLPDSALRPVIQRATGPRDNRYPDAEHLLAAVEQAASAYTSIRVSPEDRLARLRPRLSGATLDELAADELLDWLASGDIEDQIDMAGRTLIATSAQTIQYMWSANPAGLRNGFRHLVEWMKTSDFAFDYCDEIANATRTIVRVTGDTDVLRGAITGLGRLGCSHNRWHVRSVLTEILQDIRDPSRAVAALEGLQLLGDDELRWSITDFAARSMHPVLRKGIANLMDPPTIAS